MIAEIFLTILLVMLNGFFVAAEFSIVKVRLSQVQLEAEKGNRFAKVSENIINHLDTYLSATQLGITLASLGLGWIGEPVVAKMISAALASFGVQLSDKLLHTVSMPLGFLAITVLHIVFGELAPKSIAIRKAETTAFAVSYPLLWFYLLFRPFIWLMNSTSNLFLKIIGIQPVGEHEIHSADELRLIVKQSKDAGAIHEANYEIIKNAFDFTDHSARQIMIPRQKIFAIEADTPVTGAVEKLLENGYSRVPVYEDTMDKILGIIYTKDVLKEHYRNPNVQLKDLIRPAYFVYHTKRISEILAEFQKKHMHIAVVIDEYGGTLGLISLEDILEELVGEIQDEGDEEKPVVTRKEDGTFIIQASQPLIDINEFLPRPLPLSSDYTTLSGLLLNQFGRIPQSNETISIGNYNITILKMQNWSIQTIALKDLEAGPIE